MPNEMHRRIVRIEALDLQLRGVDAQLARAVAAALPGAIQAALSRAGDPAEATRSTNAIDAPTIARKLALQVAARIRAGLDTHTEAER
jgi:hypothetical protein